MPNLLLQRSGSGIAEITDPGSDSLTPFELRQALEVMALSPASIARGAGLLVIDLRPRRAFSNGHLPGSHSIPAGLLLSGEGPEGDLVLVDGGDGSAERVREALYSAGHHRRILVLEGGFPAWRAAALPETSHGPSPIGLLWRRWIHVGASAPELLGPGPLQPLAPGWRRA